MAALKRENARLARLVAAQAAEISALRAAQPSSNGLVAAGGLQLRSRELRFGTARVALTATDSALLRLLLERSPELVTHDALALAARGPGALATHGTVETWISRLRHRLRRVGAASLIETVRGAGYRIA